MDDIDALRFRCAATQSGHRWKGEGKCGGVSSPPVHCHSHHNLGAQCTRRQPLLSGAHGTVKEPGAYYAFWSGLGSDLAEFAIIGTVATGVCRLVRKYNCHQARCWRLGNHPATGGQFMLCCRHHPDYPGAAGHVRNDRTTAPRPRCSTGGDRRQAARGPSAPNLSRAACVGAPSPDEVNVPRELHLAEIGHPASRAPSICGSVLQAWDA
jgi:hypothetical protein